MRITPFKIIMGFCAMTALLMTFAIYRIPVPENTDNVKNVELKTADTVRIINMSKAEEPKPTITERIVPDVAVKAPPIIVMESDDDDICTRHHMRKVYIRNGKSWRCRQQRS
jgi:hypothetical protein